MKPADDEKDFRYFMYNLGGCLVNIGVGLPMVIFALVFNDFLNEYVALSILGVGIIWFYMGLINLIPLGGAVPNDGTNIREAKKSKDAQRAFYLMLKVNYEQQNGKFTETYPEDTFILPENADLKNFLTSYVIFFRSEQLQNLGRYEEAAAETFRIVGDNELLKATPMFYSFQFVMDYAFVQAVNLNDKEKAEKAIENFKSLSKVHARIYDKFIQMKFPNFQMYNAMIKGFLENDQEKAQEIIKDVRTNLTTLQNPGLEHTIQKMIFFFSI
jgi:hypothetical protein